MRHFFVCLLVVFGLYAAWVTLGISRRRLVVGFVKRHGVRLALLFAGVFLLFVLAARGPAIQFL